MILLVLPAQVSIPVDITSVGTSYQRVEVDVHVPHVRNAVQRAYALVAWFRWLSDEMSRESRRIRDDLDVERTREDPGSVARKTRENADMEGTEVFEFTRGIRMGVSTSLEGSWEGRRGYLEME